MATPVAATQQPPVSDHDGEPPRPQPGSWARIALAVRPFLISAGASAAVAALFAVAWEAPPFSPLTRYALRAGELVAVATGAGVMWWAHRRGRSWDADVVPALVGVVAAGTLLTVLHGTPYAPWGLQGDQSFRTEAITRFADTWWGDYFYRDRPAYYPPAFFWLLGRAADLFGIVPWHMLKYGTILGGFLVPLVSYLLWRRIVPARTAALLAGIALISQNYYEPYAWIVLVAIIPWWLEAVHGLTRPDLRPRRLLGNALIGAVLFTTYYYYFLVLPIAYATYLVVEYRRRELAFSQVRRGLATLALAAAGSAVFWLPLLVNFLTSRDYYAYNNRYFHPSMAELALPFAEPSLIGALALVGLGFLVWTARREALSRSLLVIAAALYAWHVLGFLLAAAQTPLMSYKMRELVTLVLLVGGVLALVRLAGYAAGRFATADVWRLAAVAGMVLALVACDRYVSPIMGSPDFPAAHAQPLPDGQLPRFHEDGARTVHPSAEELRAAIDVRYTGVRQPVVFTDRIDLYALYPYFGFVQWQAHYSHPTADFRGRIDFLENLARAATPDEFAGRVAANPFDPIDVIILRKTGGSLTFRYKDSEFPNGSRDRSISIPARLVDPPHFKITTLGDYLVAVRRP